MRSPFFTSLGKGYVPKMVEDERQLAVDTRVLIQVLHNCPSDFNFKLEEHILKLLDLINQHEGEVEKLEHRISKVKVLVKDATSLVQQACNHLEET
jgi:hypothetical protein